MADSKKISDLTPVTSLENTDEFLVIDKQGFTDTKDSGGGGKTSKITLENLKTAIGSQGAQGVPGNDGIQGPAGPVAGTDKQFIYNANGSAAGADVYYDLANNGRVGIGTASPGARLSVATDNSATVGSFISTNTSGVSGSAKVVHIENNTASGEGILTGLDVDISGASTATKYSAIFNGGNVGIGTDSPNAPVEISSSETTGLLLVNPDSAVTNDSNDPPAILFQANGWDTNAGSEEYRARIRVKGDYSGAANRGNTHPVIHFDLETNEDNPDDALSTRMVINAGGNVGIGTDLNDIDSGFGLSIHNRDGILVRNLQGALNSQTNIIRGSISDRYDQDDWGVGINQVCESNSNGFGMAFYTRNSYNGSYSEKVRIDKDGNVGIGATSPTHKLHIEGGVRIQPSALKPGFIFGSLNNDTPDGTYLQFNSAGEDNLSGHSASKITLQSLEQYGSNQGGYRDLILNEKGGNVGIGTASPSETLEVAGTAKMTRAKIYGLDIRGFGDTETELTDLLTSGQVSEFGTIIEGNQHGQTMIGIRANDPGDGLHIISKGYPDPVAAEATRPYNKNVATFRSNGNVGIGTASPVTALDINKEIGEASPIITLSRGGVSKSRFAIANATSSILDGSVTDDLCIRTEGGNIRFGTESATKTDMSILSNGNVGIGTDNPTANLEIRNPGQVGQTGFHIWNDSDGAPGAQGLIGSYTSYGTKLHTETAPDFSYYTGIDMTEEGSPPNFKIGYANQAWAKPGSSNDLVVITSGGRVGIGTGFSPDPTQAVTGLLHLNCYHEDGNAELIFNYASNIFANTTAQQVGISYTDALHFGSEHNDAPLIAMTLKSNGDVVVANGVSASGFDADNLDNVRATEASGLDNINNLVVSDFEKDGVTKVGIVAQDMQKVLPQSVSGGDEYEEVVAEAEGDVVSGQGTDDEHVHSVGVKKSDFENSILGRASGATFVETKAEETETRLGSLGTSNDELIATLVKAVQELSAELNELKSK